MRAKVEPVRRAIGVYLGECFEDMILLIAIGR